MIRGHAWRSLRSAGLSSARPTLGFVAGPLVAGTGDACRVLDAGAGIGALSEALLRCWLAGDFPCSRVEVDACEIDDSLHPYLAGTLGKYAQYPGVSVNICSMDFVDAAAPWLSGGLFASDEPLDNIPAIERRSSTCDPAGE